jgi:hypothetical protein
MRPDEYWKNFNLGEELGISGAFIYNGIRRFHEMRSFHHTDEIFEVLYNLCVGLERLFKIAVVLLEHSASGDQTALEESLITHSLQELLGRVTRLQKLNISTPHHDLLELLTRFYISLRYDRFTLQSVYQTDKERIALCNYLNKHLGTDLDPRESMFGNYNDDRYRNFVRRVVTKIASELYGVVAKRARALNLYTYELRYTSKAATVFMGKADVAAEDILWKELLVFFMNTKGASGYLTFLRNIEPLPFDPGLIEDYLNCFQSETGPAEVIGELETHYEDLTDKGERLRIMGVIGSPGVSFPEDDDEDQSFPTDNEDGAG